MSQNKVWQVEMPSNIALIKYMGKKDTHNNIPSNDSISWTLNHLKTTVQLTENSKDEDRWQLLPGPFPFEMSETGRKKFLNHLARMKEHFGLKQSFDISSSNNFPADCGIASSASSFAALTEACAQAFSELTGMELSIKDKAKLSSLGSGSSCRSFFSGLVLWNDEGVQPIESPWSQLLHMVVIVGGGAKKVSSSEAHKRVESSALFEHRSERSQTRLKNLMTSMQQNNWSNLYEIVWSEFWDMHALFETSHPAFGYFQADSIEVLNHCRHFWSQESDGPLVTMDAGPNIHLLWRPDQSELALKFYKSFLQNHWTTLSNIEGIGFAQV